MNKYQRNQEEKRGYQKDRQIVCDKKQIIKTGGESKRTINNNKGTRKERNKRKKSSDRPGESIVQRTYDGDAGRSGDEDEAKLKGEGNMSKSSQPPAPFSVTSCVVGWLFLIFSGQGWSPPTSFLLLFLRGSAGGGVMVRSGVFSNPSDDAADLASEYTLLLPVGDL